MPRGQAPFSLQKRPASKKEAEKKRGGKKYRYVYYAQFRDQQGNYTSAISTGESSEGAARAWAMEYLRKGNVPTHRGNTFAKFAANWWVPGECLYLKEQEASGYKKSPKYIAESRRNLENRLLPYFGPRKLTSIRPEDIINWKHQLHEKGDPETGRKLSAATINRALATLKVMLKEAVKFGYLQTNPAAEVGILKEDAKPKGTLTQKEATKLLNEKTIDTVWDGSYYHYVLNLTAAHTGMRLGEILGLTPAAIKKGELEVKHSWNGTEFGLGDTKTHESRQVPIPKEVEDHLKALVAKRTAPGAWDLVFAYREDGAPLSDKRIGARLYDALKKINIPEEERDRRNITFHSWRAFFNTAALNAGVNENLVRKITGHKTAQMTNHYTRPNVADMTAITELQKDLVKPRK
ncbi:MAG: site-specific integrase [Spirochaeta sp.]|jgi:integrase|nr:site-specific integrase [Spirochaeta sp.]